VRNLLEGNVRFLSLSIVDDVSNDVLNYDLIDFSLLNLLKIL
jgi:hypothetical protein